MLSVSCCILHVSVQFVFPVGGGDGDGGSVWPWRKLGKAWRGRMGSALGDSAKCSDDNLWAKHSVED